MVEHGSRCPVCKRFIPSGNFYICFTSYGNIYCCLKCYEEEKEKRMKNKQIMLIMADLMEQDDNNIARIDDNLLSILNLKNDDKIEIIGKNKIVCRVYRCYPSDKEINIIRVGKNIRKKLGVEIGNKVIVGGFRKK